MTGKPDFDSDFQDKLSDLFKWRRDVRHFLPDPISREEVLELLEEANLAPSVGLSQPWRFVLVETQENRQKVIANFENANRNALNDYNEDKAKLYSQLKLAGLKEAPVHLAVFCDEGTEKGAGLGRRTMPEMLRYSVVTSIQLLWLAARAKGIGVGWVSIMDPEKLKQDLAISEKWQLVGYLCVGKPKQEQITPELERAGWESREELEKLVFKR